VRAGVAAVQQAACINRLVRGLFVVLEPWGSHRVSTLTGGRGVGNTAEGQPENVIVTSRGDEQSQASDSRCPKPPLEKFLHPEHGERVPSRHTAVDVVSLC